MKVIYSTERKPGRYMVQQANWGSSRFYGDSFHRFKWTAIVSTWISALALPGEYHFRVVDTKEDG